VNPPAPSLRRRLLRAPALWLLLVIALCGAFAPAIANGVPLALCDRGAWSFPALAESFGRPTAAPDGGGWRRWLQASRPAGVAVWLPPIPHDPLATDGARANQPPSAAHWLGCDAAGRDLLARLVHGARGVALVAVPSVLLAALLGVWLGALAGLRRGVVEAVVLRLVELVACLPMLLFLMFAAAWCGGSAMALRATLVALLWPSFARVVRGELLALAEQEFVRTARGLGLADGRILRRHVLPQLAGQVATTAAFCLAAAVVAESTLSFLGLGPGGAAPTWGALLRDGAAQAALGGWRQALVPAAALLALVVACHRVAERCQAHGAAAAADAGD
jgi:ABC-type dipeptide/oligopeptide/nickel transport system permease subunit